MTTKWTNVIVPNDIFDPKMIILYMQIWLSNKMPSPNIRYISAICFQRDKLTIYKMFDVRTILIYGVIRSKN